MQGVYLTSFSSAAAAAAAAASACGLAAAVRAGRGLRSQSSGWPGT